MIHFGYCIGLDQVSATYAPQTLYKL